MLSFSTGVFRPWVLSFSTGVHNQILVNRIYAGKVAWGSVEYNGTHEPLVSEETINEVQRLLDLNRNGTKQFRHTHYLRGMVWCGSCGSRLSSLTAKGRYAYFYCLGASTRRTKCTEPYIAAEELEREVERLYDGLTLPPGIRDDIQSALGREIASREEHEAHRAKFVSRRMKRLTTEREKLLQAWYADAIPLEIFKAEQSRISAELSQLHAEIENKEEQEVQARELIELALKLLDNIAHSYRAAPPEIRKQYNQAFLKKIVVAGKRVARVEYQEPFATLLSSRKSDWVVPTGFEPVSPP